VSAVRGDCSHDWRPPLCAAVMTELLASDSAGIVRAAALLRVGKLVAFGTETVYGLGADATNAAAVARIFAAKDRPRFNPLICHYPDADAAFAHVAANDVARRLVALWPGPLTLVLPRRRDCPVALLTGAGLDTLAVRVPAHGVAQALLRAVGRPVAAPSANRSGRVSPTEVSHVLAELGGRIDAVVDSGPCVVGVESTVLDGAAAAGRRDAGGDRGADRPGGSPRGRWCDAAIPRHDAVALRPCPARSFARP
jgi:L-threonylcarbamoyladenylate synthase